MTGTNVTSFPSVDLMFHSSSTFSLKLYSCNEGLSSSSLHAVRSANQYQHMPRQLPITGALEGREATYLEWSTISLTPAFAHLLRKVTQSLRYSPAQKWGKTWDWNACRTGPAKMLLTGPVGLAASSKRRRPVLSWRHTLFTYDRQICRTSVVVRCIIDAAYHPNQSTSTGTPIFIN